MDTTYIVRLDDACATNDLQRWDYVEKKLDDLGIKPIVGVISHCKDIVLNRGTFDNNFWDRVRKWDSKGWQLALHGYTHQYISKKAGLVPLNKYSEFAGVPISEQRKKIKESYDLFLKNGVKPKIWMAPAHTFDKNTLKVLMQETEIRIITDGIALRPFNKYGFLWIPQQCWGFSSFKRGIWTICLHIETDTLENLNNLFGKIEENLSFFQFDYDKMINVFRNRKKNWQDVVYSYKFFIRRFYEHKLKHKLKFYFNFNKKQCNET